MAPAGGEPKPPPYPGRASKARAACLPRPGSLAACARRAWPVPRDAEFVNSAADWSDGRTFGAAGRRHVACRIRHLRYGTTFAAARGGAATCLDARTLSSSSNGERL